MNKVGQPSKFTPEVRQSILHSIGRGIPKRIAAEANGVHESTYHLWITQGQKDILEEKQTDHAQFVIDVRKIEQERIARHVSNLDQSIERWQSHAWLLERRWWKDFSGNAAAIDIDRRLRQMEIEQMEGNSDKQHGELINEIRKKIDGGALDSERNKAQRSLASQIESANGKEDPEC